MRFKSFKIGKSKEKPDRDTAEVSDALTTPIAVLEEQVDNKTKEPEATEPELKELSDTAKDSEADKDAPPQPHGPLSELSVEPGDEPIDEETDIGTLLGEADEQVKVVEAEAEAGAAAPAEAEKQPATEEESDSLDSLFNQEEDEVNPLANLINSLPDVTAQELLDDLQEIKEIIREWQQN